MKREYKVEGLENSNPNNFGGMCSRAIVLERKDIDFEKGIDTIATTEAPAIVIDWERWQMIREILPMRYCEMPDNDKVPFLDSHSRISMEKVKGSSRNWTLSEDKLMCKTFISEAENDLRMKIKEGHIDSVSIGYLTDKNYTVEVPKKTEVVIDGIKYRNDFDDNVPLIIRTWWKTRELSGVAIGADAAAKFKSFHDEGIQNLIVQVSKLTNEVLELKNGKQSVQTDEDHKRALLEKKMKLRSRELLHTK